MILGGKKRIKEGKRVDDLSLSLKKRKTHKKENVQRKK